MQVQAEPWANEMKGLAGPGGGVSPGQEAGVGRCMGHKDEARFRNKEKALCLCQLMIF